MVCEMCPEGPCVYPRLEFSCYEALTGGMQQILDYFFNNYNSQEPSVTLPQDSTPVFSAQPYTEKPYGEFFFTTENAIFLWTLKAHATVAWPRDGLGLLGAWTLRSMSTPGWRGLSQPVTLTMSGAGEAWSTAGGSSLPPTALVVTPLGTLRSEPLDFCFLSSPSP